MIMPDETGKLIPGNLLDKENDVHYQPYRALFNPGRIGQMELKNRLVMAPMGTYLANRDGTVIERLKKYYEERARGGVALIIVEIAGIDHPRGRAMTRQIAISDDKFIPGLSDLAAAIHSHGAKMGIQLHHGGRIASPLLSGGNEAVAPSPAPLIPAQLGSARELTINEIANLVRCYAMAAGRAKKAGIDGVEIHAGHGYLISQFLSPSINQRRDQYGGTLENRARFFMEVVAAVRTQVGKEYPVWCRLDGQEFSIPDGLPRQDALRIAKMAAGAGLDAIHVSGYGGSEGVHFTEGPLVNQPGFLLPLAREIKKAVDIPIIAVGRLSPEMADKTIKNQGADFIALGRPLIADPELPGKLAAGKPENLRPCIYCYNCVHQIFVRNNLNCSVNAMTGKESEINLQPAEKIKKVMVIGSGPAGMEAARVAALRGHQVSLYEQERVLGGSLAFAGLVRRENGDLIKYLSTQMRLLKVQVNLGTKVTPDMVRVLKPEVLILATGSVRKRPDIPGIDLRKVLDGDDLRAMLTGREDQTPLNKMGVKDRLILSMSRLISGVRDNPSLIRRLSRIWMPLGQRVIIIGGGLVGCELAEFLAERRRQVIILERGEQAAAEMALPMKWIVLDKLDRLKVRILPCVNILSINDWGVSIRRENGSTEMIAADNIIVAEGIEPDHGVQAVFQGLAPEIFSAGDCVKVSLIKDSIAEAFKIASMI
jgi:2,4-dienoyl-CoA reductase-like NADH-dependent reductase (Old Yellow Enzyme family)/thioredoxin reductase